MSAVASEISAVVIGRNEGERLKTCLRSLSGRVGHIVYVDSGSTDGSVEFARSLDVEVVELDMSRPFTMARGRNAGFERVGAGDSALVQFVDGDCEVVEGWIEAARDAFAERPDVGVVAGRRRERHPEASIYNRLCDIEWDRPVGEVKSCLGDAMIRVPAFREVSGFDEGLIAGEEAEMCLRLRTKGWKVLSIPVEMTLHDAAITRFSQWWKRAVRTGHAYAEGAAMHGRGPERHHVRPVRSALFWGALVPAVFLAGLAVTPLTPWGLAAAGGALLLFSAQIARVYRGASRIESARHRLLYAVFMMIAKIPHVLGVALYRLNRLRGRRARIIEYKTATPKETGA